MEPALRPSVAELPPARARRVVANRVGSLSLAVTDAMMSAVRVGDESLGEAAALVLLTTLPQPVSVGRVAQVLALSHSGTVRLVDRLESQGWVTRSRGSDARQVHLTLTAAGRARRRRASKDRLDVLEACLQPLDTKELVQLNALLAKVLGARPSAADEAYRICRFCDGDLCTSAQCPVEATLDDAHRLHARASR